MGWLGAAALALPALAGLGAILWAWWLQSLRLVRAVPWILAGLGAAQVAIAGVELAVGWRGWGGVTLLVGAAYLVAGLRLAWSTPR